MSIREESEATIQKAKEIEEANTVVTKFVDFTKPKRTDEEKESGFIGKKFIPLIKNAVNSLVSPGGTGKTVTSLKIAIEAVKEENMRVYAHLSEDQEGDINDTVHLMANVDKKLIDNLKVESVLTEPSRVADSQGKLTDKYQKIMALWADYDLVILDPLVSFIDEMDNEVADMVFSILNRFCAENNVTILLLHHTSKNTGISRGVTTLTNKPRLVYELRKVMIEVKTGSKTVEKVDETQLHRRELSVFKVNNGYYHKLLDNHGKESEWNEYGHPRFKVEIFKKKDM